MIKNKCNLEFVTLMGGFSVCFAESSKKGWRYFNVLICVCLLLCSCSQPTQKVAENKKVTVYDVQDYTSNESQKALKWYGDAKFGMFVHWGLYTGIGPWDKRKKNLPNDEYLARGKDFASNLKPDEWVKLAKQAGMKWITLTSKHHDGFAIYPSKDKYNVGLTGYKGDPIGELKASCDNNNVKLGFYYSQFQDWNHEQGGSHDVFLDDEKSIESFDQYVDNKAVSQLNELMDRYDPFMIWFDTPQRTLLKHSLKFRKTVKDKNPSTIICSRIGHELGDYISGGDGGSPEKPLAGLWETCWVSAINWSYNPDVENYQDILNVNEKKSKKIKSAQDIVKRLFNITAGGGVLLLNMGPRMDGSIPDYYLQEWPKVGKWIKVHEKAIYGTSVNPYFSPDPVCTTKDDHLFVYLDPSTKGGQFVLPGLNNKVEKVTIVSDKQQRELKFKRENNKLIIDLPEDLSYYYEADFPNLIDITVDGQIAVDAGTGIFVQESSKAIQLTPSYFGSFQGEKDLSQSVRVDYGRREPVYATFKIVEPGTYNISMELSSPKGHGGINIRLHDKLFVLEEDNNKHGDFYDQELGNIKIDEKGNYSVLISSTKFVFRGYKDKYPEDVTRDVFVKNVTLERVK